MQRGGTRVYPVTASSKRHREQKHLIKKFVEEVPGPHREFLAIHPLLSRLVRKATGSPATPRDFTLVKRTAMSCKGLQGQPGGH